MEQAWEEQKLSEKNERLEKIKEKAKKEILIRRKEKAKTIKIIKKEMERQRNLEKEEEERKMIEENDLRNKMIRENRQRGKDKCHISNFNNLKKEIFEKIEIEKELIKEKELKGNDLKRNELKRIPTKQLIMRERAKYIFTLPDYAISVIDLAKLLKCTKPTAMDTAIFLNIPNDKICGPNGIEYSLFLKEWRDLQNEIKEILGEHYPYFLPI